MNTWTIDSARERYCVPRWSEGFFDVEPDGEVSVCVAGDGSARASLSQLGQLARDAGMSLPLLLRFPQILQARASQLCQAFERACQTQGYRQGYTPVYPIKVNQQHDVVSALADHPKVAVGLEAGSKPELLAVLGMSRANGLVVCNGYKDREYVRLALMGRQLGLRVVIVIEKPSELDLVLQQARELDIDPLLGVRLRLTSIGGGNWQNTGGRRAKFGLVASQLLELMERLENENLIASLDLLHFHMGSQIASIQDIATGISEAMRYFVSMRKRGAPLSMLDLGGGIGVDYEGSNSSGYFSINYHLNDYAEAVVKLVSEVCERNDQEHPHLITEAGRAMTAHHAVLLTEVIEVEPMPGTDPPSKDEENPILAPLSRLASEPKQRSAAERLATADDQIHILQDQFVAGSIDLRTRAAADELYYRVLRGLRAELLTREGPQDSAIDGLIEDLNERLADKYFCNFSIFQSLPDIWGLNQVFPIMPINGLDREPTQRAVLEDLTCDSDGRIDRFVDSGGIEGALAVHAVESSEPYVLGVFLVGAYQETLGDIHNLFGDTDVANVCISGNDLQVRPSHGGDSATDLLKLVGYLPDDILENVKKMATNSGLTASQSHAISAAVGRSLAQSTYLRRDDK